MGPDYPEIAEEQASWGPADAGMLGPVAERVAKAAVMAEKTTILRPLTAEDAEALIVAVFADEDPDPSGYLLKQGRPGTVAELEGLVGWLVDGSSVGNLHPSCSSAGTAGWWAGAAQSGSSAFSGGWA